MCDHSSKMEKTIENAFLELCLEKGGIDVSVSSVAARANISRGTFYLYYEDIYALIEAIQTRLLDTFQNKVSSGIPIILKRNKYDSANLFFNPMAMFLQENKKAVLVFMGRNGSTQFIYKMKKLAKENLRELFLKIPKKHTEYLIEFIVSAALGLIVYWLENDCVLPFNDLANMITTILYEGPIAAGMKDF